jgi:enoyl-[acyl-carrier-protein] reductase (NADH)
MGRVANAEGIANVVQFPTSDKASYVTGAAFFVDGGMTLYPSFASNEEHNTEKHSDITSKKRGN